MLDIPQLDQYKDDSGVQMDSMDSIEEDLPVAIFIQRMWQDLDLANMM